VEIANALLSGRTVDQIAEQRGVTSGTLRVQLKTIFQKTDTRRQSDLLKLLLSLPASPPRTGRMA
jgi:DNA-binding CsgD family transcriptional regulator